MEDVSDVIVCHGESDRSLGYRLTLPVDDLRVVGWLPLDGGEMERADLPWCVLSEPTLQHHRHRSLTGRQVLVRRHGKEQHLGVRPVPTTLYHRLQKFCQVWVEVTQEHDALAHVLTPVLASPFPLYVEQHNSIVSHNETDE